MQLSLQPVYNLFLMVWEYIFPPEAYRCFVNPVKEKKKKKQQKALQQKTVKQGN